MGCTTSVPCGGEAPVPIPTSHLLGLLPTPVLPHEQRAAGKLLRLLRATQDGSPWTPATMRHRIIRAMRGHDALPHAYRWFTYQFLSGGLELELHYSGLYKALLQLGRATDVDLTLRHDCHRTLPYMPFFGPRHRPGPGQSQLYRILTAYAHLDPEVGYTQGMNFVVALLLCCGLNEQTTFFVFAGIMTRMNVRLFYLPGLPMALAAHQTLAGLLSRKASALADQLQGAGIMPALYSTPWLLSFFISSPLPPSTILCVMDRLMLETPLRPIPPVFAESYAAAVKLTSPSAVANLTDMADRFFGAASTGGQGQGDGGGGGPGDGGSGSVGARGPNTSSSPVHRVVRGEGAAGSATASTPAPLYVVTPWDIPRIYLRACLRLVLRHEPVLAGLEDDSDALYATIKDEYAKFPWQLDTGEEEDSSGGAGGAGGAGSARVGGDDGDGVAGGGGEMESGPIMSFSATDDGSAAARAAQAEAEAVVAAAVLRAGVLDDTVDAGVVIGEEGVGGVVGVMPSPPGFMLPPPPAPAPPTPAETGRDALGAVADAAPAGLVVAEGGEQEEEVAPSLLPPAPGDGAAAQGCLAPHPHSPPARDNVSRGAGLTPSHLNGGPGPAEVSVDVDVEVGSQVSVVSPQSTTGSPVGSFSPRDGGSVSDGSGGAHAIAHAVHALRAGGSSTAREQAHGETDGDVSPLPSLHNPSASTLSAVSDGSGGGLATSSPRAGGSGRGARVGPLLKSRSSPHISSFSMHLFPPVATTARLPPLPPAHGHGLDHSAPVWEAGVGVAAMPIAEGDERAGGDGADDAETGVVRSGTSTASTSPALRPLSSAPTGFLPPLSMTPGRLGVNGAVRAEGGVAQGSARLSDVDEVVVAPTARSRPMMGAGVQARFLSPARMFGGGGGGGGGGDGEDGGMGGREGDGANGGLGAGGATPVSGEVAAALQRLPSAPMLEHALKKAEGTPVFDLHPEKNLREFGAASSYRRLSDALILDRSALRGRMGGAASSTASRMGRAAAGIGFRLAPPASTGVTTPPHGMRDGGSGLEASMPGVGVLRLAGRRTSAPDIPDHGSGLSKPPTLHDDPPSRFNPVAAVVASVLPPAASAAGYLTRFIVGGGENGAASGPMLHTSSVTNADGGGNGEAGGGGGGGRDGGTHYANALRPLLGQSRIPPSPLRSASTNEVEHGGDGGANGAGLHPTPTPGGGGGGGARPPPVVAGSPARAGAGTASTAPPLGGTLFAVSSDSRAEGSDGGDEKADRLITPKPPPQPPSTTAAASTHPAATTLVSPPTRPPRWASQGAPNVTVGGTPPGVPTVAALTSPLGPMRGHTRRDTLLIAAESKPLIRQPRKKAVWAASLGLRVQAPALVGPVEGGGAAGGGAAGGGGGLSTPPPTEGGVDGVAAPSLMLTPSTTHPQHPGSITSATVAVGAPGASGATPRYAEWSCEGLPCSESVLPLQFVRAVQHDPVCNVSDADISALCRGLHLPLHPPAMDAMDDGAGISIGC